MVVEEESKESSLATSQPFQAVLGRASLPFPHECPVFLRGTHTIRVCVCVCECPIRLSVSSVVNQGSLPELCVFSSATESAVMSSRRGSCRLAY